MQRRLLSAEIKLQFSRLRNQQSILAERSLSTTTMTRKSSTVLLQGGESLQRTDQNCVIRELHWKNLGTFKRSGHADGVIQQRLVDKTKEREGLLKATRRGMLRKMGQIVRRRIGGEEDASLEDWVSYIVRATHDVEMLSDAAGVADRVL